MTQRERILAVYRGEQPDVVPFMLDLSHWFYHREQRPWDLSHAYLEPERELIDYHRRHGVGFYLPNLASFYSVHYPDHVRAETVKRMTPRGPEITWRLTTPSGAIERVRSWQEETYSWGIDRWGFEDTAGLRVLREALAGRRFTPHWDRFRQWEDCVGDTGVVYLAPGYSAMGMLLNQWMGVEATVFATMDFPDELHEAIDAINANQLELIDLLCTSPAQVVIISDNFSSDVQPPAFFAEWSRAFYVEAARRLHAAGKFLAVHIDGRLRGAIRMIRETGADCADAVTPAPMGDLTVSECREEAGPKFILSGGIPPHLWLPSAPLQAFTDQIHVWLAQKAVTSRFIANVGDQVPPGAEERRIALMRDLVEENGRFHVNTPFA